MIRVFVSADALSATGLRLVGADARHIGGALRVRPEEELVAVTEDGLEHHCRVTSASPRLVEATLLSSAPSQREPRARVRLCLAHLKGDQFDRIVEYASEMGVDSVQPMITERTIARVDPERLQERMARWRQIARQGAELGQRGRLPAILEPVDARQAIADAGLAGMSPLLLYEGERLPSLSAIGIDAAAGVCVLVGPEGGWTEAEVRLAQDSGAVAVSLGPRIMRPLPAALTAVAVVLHRAGDLELKEK